MAVKVLAKRGTAAQIEGAASSVQTAGEIAFATDTKQFYVSDGTQFNKIGKDQLSQFGEISVVNEISSWHLSTTNILDLNPPEANPTGITFKPDGTRMFTLGYSRNRVQQYDLSTAWDLTSAGSATESEYLVQNNLSSTQEDFFIDSSGTRMYVLSRGSDSIGQFTLNTAWDISDITFVQDLHVNSTSLSGGVAGFVTGEDNPAGITFKPDGTILYLVGYTQDKVHQIPLSTAWDISTHGTITELSISPANSSQAIQFSLDGKEMYILDYSLDGIAHFTLSTAWDVTTANLTAQSIAFIRVNEATPTGLYYRDDLGKCFIVGRSGDFAREVIANDIYSFNEGITAPVVYSPQINADRITTGGGGGGANNFYNTTYARTTFQSDTTTYLAYATSAPLIRLGNYAYNNTRIQVTRFTYFGPETVDDPTRVPRFMVFPSLAGAKSKVYFGQFLEDTTYLVGGSMDIESIADTFDHKGEITLGGELKVSGTKPLAYKNPNLYTQGTQIVLDNFNETTQTTLDNHTPDTGSGYTNVYISSAITFPTHLPIIEANAGYLRPAVSNSNDGYRFVNDTTISTNNYEARAVIKRQHGGDDPFVLFVKYIDEDNYFAIAFGNNYVYCTPISVVNGVYSTHGYLYYYANTSTADNENIEVALRVVGNNVHVFYEGVYRGSREINITGAGKAGIGFGKMNNSQYSGYDIGINNHISKFEIYELPDSLFDGSDSVHYIENGKLGIGTTSPTSPLHVAGNLFVDGSSLKVVNNSVTNYYDSDRMNSYGTYYDWRFAGNTKMRITSTGRLGIGTTSPDHLLHVSGNAKMSNIYLLGNIIHEGDVDTQIKFATDTITFDTAGSERLTINSTGNVGIGTTSPVGILHAYSTSAPVIESPSNAAIIIRRNDNVGYSSLLKYHSGNSEKFVAGLSDSGDFTNSTGEEYFIGTTKTNPLVVLKNDGKLGIGTTNPSTKFHVDGNIRVGDVNDVIYTNKLHGLSIADLTLYTSGNTLLTQTGNVGIGTTSPTSLLHIKDNVNGRVHIEAGPSGGTSNSTARLIIEDNTSNAIQFITPAGSFNSSIYFGDADNNSQGLINYNHSTDQLTLEGNSSFLIRSGGQNRLIVNSSGNVGIGTTSPTTALQVVGRTKTSELHASNGNAIYTNQGSVAIGTSQVDATAVLNIVSTTKGVLFPRMTGTQREAIEEPATGLIVYQTDATEGLYIYKSTGWTQII